MERVAWTVLSRTCTVASDSNQRSPLACGWLTGGQAATDLAQLDHLTRDSAHRRVPDVGWGVVACQTGPGCQHDQLLTDNSGRAAVEAPSP